VKFLTAAVPVALLVLAGSAMAAPIVFGCNALDQQNVDRYASHMCPQFSGVGLLGVPLDLTGEMLSTIVFTSGGENSKPETEAKTPDFSLESLFGSTFSPSFFVGTSPIVNRPSRLE
jgi:hypothetical protein